MENQTETLQKEPLFNVPPLTLWLTAFLLFCFALLQNQKLFDLAVPLLSFIPQQFTAAPVFYFYTLFSYALLHFGWLHIATNLSGLLAFGSGVERLLGRRIFCLVFIGGVLIGALGHWALFMHGEEPLGGASAGISALFGAVLPMMVSKRRDLAIASIIFILTNLVIGLIGVPQQPGLAIAWQAHIVGFLFGMIFVFGFFYFKNKKQI
jgi:membrane associated rhomboid family serine protease